jgi:hypothetical protein
MATDFTGKNKIRRKQTKKNQTTVTVLSAVLQNKAVLSPRIATAHYASRIYELEVDGYGNSGVKE